MTWTRSPATRAILGVLAVYILMIGVLMGMRWSGLQVGSSARVGLAIAFTIPMGWLVLNYWRAIDEAAREAQKWAWFWGGSGGMAVALVTLLNWPRWVIETLADGPGPIDALHAGAALLIGAQLVGFLAAWIFWWVRRR